jgi:hypothetical protein
MHHCKVLVLTITTNAARANLKQSTSNQGWSRPEPRQVKVNVDGLFNADSHAGSTEAIIRDYEGKFVASCTLFLPNVASAAAAEAIAMREGLSLANHLGCNNVQVESDSIEIVQACMGEESWWGDSSAIFADCIDLAIIIENVKF